jgi:hypothetical protein
MILIMLLKFIIHISSILEVVVYMFAGAAGNKDIGILIKVKLYLRRAWKTLLLAPKWYSLHFKPLRKLCQFMLHFLSIKWLMHIHSTHNTDSFIYEDNIYKLFSVSNRFIP